MRSVQSLAENRKKLDNSVKAFHYKLLADLSASLRLIRSVGRIHRTVKIATRHLHGPIWRLVDGWPRLSDLWLLGRLALQKLQCPPKFEGQLFLKTTLRDGCELPSCNFPTFSSIDAIGLNGCVNYWIERRTMTSSPTRIHSLQLREITFFLSFDENHR